MLMRIFHKTDFYRKKSRQAFTLIELLVVVSIIALLVSILLPALGKARDQARTVTCASMQRQFAIAWITYTADNDGSIMRCFHGWGDDYEDTWWVSFMRPYFSGIEWSAAGLSGSWRELLLCPNQGPIDKAHKNPTWIGINERLDPYTPSSANMLPLMRIENFRSPAETVVFTDAIWDIYCNLWGGSFTYRHQGDTSSNFALADSHVVTERSRARVDINGDSLDDAFPPQKFIYDPRSDDRGWPHLNYEAYR